MIDFVKPYDTAAFLDAISEPGIRIVSLTVTEGGYYISPATQHFDPAHPDIVYDVTAPRGAEDGLRIDRRRTQAPPRRRDRAFHRDVLRQHSGQWSRHRERRRRSRRACRSRTRALDSGQRRLSQFHGRPHHARDDRPGTRHSARQVRPRGQLAGLLRRVPAMGGGGQVPGRAAGAGDGRRDVHLGRVALRIDEDPYPQWRSRRDRLSRRAARHPFRSRSDGGRCRSARSSKS